MPRYSADLRGTPDRAERFSAACDPVHIDESIVGESSGDVAIGHDSGVGHGDFGGTPR
jgi:hypothetical protein